MRPDQDPGSDPGLLPGCRPAEGAAWGLAQLDLVALLRPELSLAVTWSPWQRLEGLARAPPQRCGQLDPPPALDRGPAEGPQVPPRGVGQLLGDAGVGGRAGGPPQQLRELLVGGWGWGARAPAQGQAPVEPLERQLDLGQGPCLLGGHVWHLPAPGEIGGSSLQAPWEHGGNSQPCVRGLQGQQELICSCSGWAPCSLQVRDGCAGRQARPGADSDGLCSRTPAAVVHAPGCCRAQAAQLNQCSTDANAFPSLPVAVAPLSCSASIPREPHSEAVSLLLPCSTLCVCGQQKDPPEDLPESGLTSAAAFLCRGEVAIGRATSPSPTASGCSSRKAPALCQYQIRTRKWPGIRQRS